MKIQCDLHASKCQLCSNRNPNNWEWEMRSISSVFCESHRGILILGLQQNLKKAADPFFFKKKKMFSFYTKLHPLPLVLYLHSVFVCKSQVTFKRRTLAWGFRNWDERLIFSVERVIIDASVRQCISTMARKCNDLIESLYLSNKGVKLFLITFLKIWTQFISDILQIKLLIHFFFLSRNTAGSNFFQSCWMRNNSISNKKHLRK